MQNDYKQIDLTAWTQVGEGGNEYGTKSELIGKKQSVGRFCGEHPNQITRIANRVAELSKQMHLPCSMAISVSAT
ncbi:MAG: hypothetical protein IJS92_02945 [Paludibacteraceae bacterium]|nr:hypothetical protein [Paludibacteraceae bacterium]